MEQQVIKYAAIVVLGLAVGFGIGPLWNSAGKGDIPFIKGNYQNEFICIAGKIRSIQIPTTDDYRDFHVEFEGPWYYLSSEDLSIVGGELSNANNKQAKEWFSSNEKRFLSNFTNNYKKYGSGWTDMDGYPATGKSFFGKPSEILLMNYQGDHTGKFVFIQSSYLTRFITRSAGGSSSYVVKRSINVLQK